jgi:hypothetical protein
LTAQLFCFDGICHVLPQVKTEVAESVVGPGQSWLWDMEQHWWNSIGAAAAVAPSGLAAAAAGATYGYLRRRQHQRLQLDAVVGGILLAVLSHGLCGWAWLWHTIALYIQSLVHHIHAQDGGGMWWVMWCTGCSCGSLLSLVHLLRGHVTSLVHGQGRYFASLG